MIMLRCLQPKNHKMLYAIVGLSKQGAIMMGQGLLA